MLVPFSPPPGINSDDTSFSAAGKWIAGNNVRFVNGFPQARRGFDTLFTISGLSSSECRAILPFKRSGAISIAYGMASTFPGFGDVRLYVGSGLSAPSNRTPAALGTGIHNWSLASWGDTLLAVPETGTLYEQSGNSTATAVAAAPDNITYMLVTPERQVVALGCNEEISGTFNGLCIRGCDIEDYTDWTTTSTNNAFEHILDGVGVIVAARMVGQYLAVWTTGDLFLGQYLGDPGQTYRFDKVAGNCGLAGPNAVVIFNQRAYWVGSDLQLRSWAVGELPQILPCPMLQSTLAGLIADLVRYTVASIDARHNEVRFDYADTVNADIYPTGTAINRFIAVCLSDGAWHSGAGGRTSIIDSSEIASLTTSHADNPSIIGAYGLNGDITVDLIETGELEWSVGANNALKPYIQSGDIYLDEGERRVMVRSVYPDFRDQSENMELSLFVRDRPQSAPITKGPYELTPNGAKRDIRASGKLISVKLGAQLSAGTLYFRLGKLTFDVVPMGGR
jgi:hypothetical protein